MLYKIINPKFILSGYFRKMESNGTYRIYIIKCLNTGSSDVFFTKNHISKALYAYRTKNAEQNKTIKEILLLNNYELNILEQYDTPITKSYLNQERSFWIKHASAILDTKTIKKVTRYTVANDSKTKSLSYGLERQAEIYKYLKDNKFDTIKEALNPYSVFDFYLPDDCFLIELKSLTYSITKYPSAVMNTNKLIYNRMIFLFEHTEQDGKHLWYHIYEQNRVYNTRYITPTGRLYNTEIIDIPTTDLKPIEELNILNSFTDDERINFDLIINKIKI